ncbi:peroxiredoxin-like family protein [Psychromonas sp. 14N.309.X.WAT.B.A12]|uniref:peroxiredoxin-like family protein n=1 Tax=Psychromonas sp. 14N.309.X.WAT.B.A12 TaxID=2998322 RepID=UPI0025AF5C81|nr:peroxiredoxin-like family protein [Psychromonas sp. 14N.309.X.WAT.B.A12]MDN2662486.1 peroxiredoxin-like family protein [Psychromonas sp. 14N.309.X.WAT.B.A12]
MTTLREQTDAKIAAGRKGNPEFMRGIDDVIKEAKSFKEGSNALKLGDKAPRFTLPNQQGKLTSLDDLLAKGPVIVTFYRGSWCPYCNLQLRALQSRLEQINGLGAQLIAISPEVPDDSLTKNEISEMTFEVLSDQNADVAAQFGVAWKVPDFVLEHMKVDRHLDIEKINNGNANIMPIPATYILDKEGTAVWRFVDVDYRVRSEPEDIINELKKLA